MREISIGKKKIKVETANSFIKKAIGLMFRKKGRMLFVFAFPGRHGIWMPFIRFPIDIIFADSEGKIVAIHENAMPLSANPKTWRIYSPKKPAKYVLEVEAWLCRKNGIKEGMKLQL